MKLVFATANKGKVREAQEILGPGYEIVTPAELGFTDDVEETGLTFRENSLIKAEAVAKALGVDCFADDSGLVVDALDGAPGIYSARYASLGGVGTDHDFEDNIDRLLYELSKCPEKPRTARFRCSVTLLIGGEKHFFEGTLEGSIALQRAGCEGFGYDPVFIPACGDGRTMAEMGEDYKNLVSHRGIALRQMAQWLSTQR